MYELDEIFVHSFPEHILTHSVYHCMLSWVIKDCMIPRKNVFTNVRRYPYFGKFGLLSCLWIYKIFICEDHTPSSMFVLDDKGLHDTKKECLYECSQVSLFWNVKLVVLSVDLYFFNLFVNGSIRFVYVKIIRHCPCSSWTKVRIFTQHLSSE